MKPRLREAHKRLHKGRLRGLANGTNGYFAQIYRQSSLAVWRVFKLLMGISQEVHGMSTSVSYRSILKALLFLALITILVLLLAFLLAPPLPLHTARPTLLPTPTHQAHP